MAVKVEIKRKASLVSANTLLHQSQKIKREVSITSEADELEKYLRVWTAHGSNLLMRLRRKNLKNYRLEEHDLTVFNQNLKEIHLG